MYIVSIALVVLGSLCYHVSSRAVDRRLPVTIVLALAYATSLGIVVATGVLSERRAFTVDSLKYVGWPPYTLAAGIVLVEAGFLLAYRAGWNLSGASLVASVSSSVLLVAIGVVAVHERLSPANVSGVILSIVGLVLMNWKP